MSTNMTKATTGYAVAAAAVLAMGAPAAHHSAVQFDMTTPVTVEGTIVRFDQVNPHSYLYLERKTADGGTERWAVEGPAGAQIERRGINHNLLVAGAKFVACGYLLKDGARAPQAVEGTVLLAEAVTMPDGETRPWSPYGQTHCQDRYAAKGTLAP